MALERCIKLAINLFFFAGRGKKKLAKWALLSENHRYVWFEDLLGAETENHVCSINCNCALEQARHYGVSFMSISPRFAV
jgi:hypothetical protein